MFIFKEEIFHAFYAAATYICSVTNKHVGRYMYLCVDICGPNYMSMDVIDLEMNNAIRPIYLMVAILYTLWDTWRHSAVNISIISFIESALILSYSWQQK